MVIVLRANANREDILNIEDFLESKGLGIHTSQGTQRTIIGVIGDKTLLSDSQLELLPGVDKIVHIVEPYKLASRTFKPDDSIIDIKGVKVGGKELAVFAGPCAVESEEQIMAVAKAVKKSGAQFLRGGAFKPRTSPYAFQGLELEGLKLLHEAASAYGLISVSEITSERDVEQAAQYVDMIQIGARNAQNFKLLKEVGQSGIPALLKRGLSMTIEEWLSASEYILSEGNYKLILCERGIRTFETATRNTLDISAIPVVKELSHLPIIVDPSHASGKRALIKPLSNASVAAGADGIIVEVHPEPKKAMSDAAQQLMPDEFDSLCKDISSIAKIVGRDFHNGN